MKSEVLSRTLGVRAAFVGVAAAVVILTLSLVLFACGTEQAVQSGTAGAPTTTAATAAAGSAKAAPSFSGETLDGKTVSLEQFKGKPLFVVYMTDT